MGNLRRYPANNDPWFHMFCKWIHEFNWLNSRVSVREFTGFCDQIWCVKHVFTVKSRIFHVMTRTSETVPVLTQYDSCQTHSKLVTTSRTRVFTWIHMKTGTGGAVPIMNQYGTCQLVQKWFLVSWVDHKLVLSSGKMHHKVSVSWCFETVPFFYRCLHSGKQHPSVTFCQKSV